MFWGILHRMILIELVKIFILALIVLTGLILMAGVLSEAMKNNFSPLQMLGAIPLMLPSMLPYTVPTTTLFATCIVYGRLAADNEILALKAAGVHILHVIWPGLLLGLFASTLTMFLYIDAIPYTSFLLKCQVAGDVEELLYTLLRKDGCIRHKNLNYEIHVSNVQGRMLQDVIFKRRSGNGARFDTIVLAKKAELSVDLTQDRILVHMYVCQVAQQNTVGIVEEQVWPLDIPEFITKIAVKQRANDMTWSELFAYQAKWEQEKQKIIEEIGLHQHQIDLGQAQPHFRKHVADLVSESKTRDSQILSIQSEWHLRAAFALGCLCFALVGCPIGIWFSKADYLSAFITCFLPIVTIYYPLMFCTINMAHAGKVAPWIGIYGADLLMIVAGMVLFRRLARN